MTLRHSLIALALATTGVAFAGGAFAGDDRVRVAEMTVKERLMAIEQINVTAEKPVVTAASEDAGVMALLAELESLELDTRNKSAPAVQKD